MTKEIAAKPLPWYRDGLRFACTECGQCCTGSPGFVWVDETEIAAMAKQLEISIDLFKRKYLRLRDNRYALAEKKNHDCVFLKEKKCALYQARPSQCRTFPFWKENLNSEKSWELAAEGCEGINAQAPLVPYSAIQELLER